MPTQPEYWMGGEHPGEEAGIFLGRQRTDPGRRLTRVLSGQEDALDRKVVRRVRLDGKPGGFGGPAHDRVERHRLRSVEFPGRVPPRRASASARSARRSAAGEVSGPA